MKYLSTTEIGNLWGITNRRVLALCCGGRIPGAVKIRGRWFVPSAATKPADRRRRDETLYAMPQLTASEELRSSLVETTLLSHIAQSSRENSGELLVRDLLTLKHFHDWRIVGGAQGANRPISSLNLMESPDIANWTKENQFIVTTGYCIRDDVNAQKQIIVDLSKTGCSGLGLKIMRFFRRVPQHMIDVANQCGLPLIEIPDDHNISEIMNEIMKEVYVKKLEKTELSYALYRDFTKAAFEEREMDEIAKLLGHLLHASVTISDTNWSIVSGFSEPNLQLQLSEITAAEEPLPIYSVEREEIPLVQEREINGIRIFRNVFLLGNDDSVYGYLTVWADRRLEAETDRAIAEQAVQSATFVIRKDLRREKREYSQREAYLQDLIAGRVQSADVAAKRAMSVGMSGTGKCLCVVLRLPGTYREAVYAQCLESIKNALRHKQITAYALTAEGQTVLVLPLPQWQHQEHKPCEAEEQLLECVTKELRNMQIDGVIGVGLPTPMTALNTSFRQAVEVLRLHEETAQKEEQRIFRYADFEVETMLATIAPEKKEELHRRIISRLEDYDREHNADLLSTLITYFNAKANISETARKLFIHRNTLLFRLEKAEDLLELDLKGEDELLLRIALRLYPYIKNT